MYEIQNSGSNTSRLTACLILPLCEDTAASYAILPFLLCRGCAEYSTLTAVNRRLNELYGAEVTADVTQIGDNQALIMGITSIDDRYALGDESIAQLCAGLLCSMLFDPALENGMFSKDAVQEEKRCLTELIESEVNEKRLYARRRCVEMLCAGEGYALGRYGTADGVARLTPASVTEAWRDALSHARFFFIYQGVLHSTGAAVADELSRRLSTFTIRNLSSSSSNSAFSAVPIEKIERMDINQAKLVIGLRYCGSNLAGDAPAMRLMNALVGGSPHSLLFRNVREKYSLCYYCASTYDRLKGVMLIDSGVEESKAGKAREEILRQLDIVKNGEFSDSEMESARMSLVNQFMSICDDQASLAFWYVGQCMDDTPVSPEQLCERLMKVTREQIAEAARNVAVGAIYMLCGNISG